jgi:phage baseplate assembly protein W
MTMEQVFGTDLAVVPNMVAVDASEFDVTTRIRVIRGGLPGAANALTDLAVLSSRQNLAQALLIRLLTPVGTLAGLGHANYGSQLHLLIGRRKTDELRNLCRAYVLEAIAQEPRIQPKASQLQFAPEEESHDNFVFTVAVQPIRGGDAVSLGLEVTL